jgi:hypothetical protein
MAMKDWSTTAADNDTAGSINFAEGQAPSTVNNSARQLMADVRSWVDDGSWHNWGDSHTYNSSTSTLVSGSDVTARYHAGRRVRAVGSGTGTIYGRISSSSFSTDTTINYTWDSGSLSNEALTISIGFVQVTGKPVSATAVEASSATLAGVVELATTTEALTGTDTTRAVSVDALAALWEKGSDAASATVVSLGEGGFFHITGTTTITDIDFATDKSGRSAVLVFDSALTLTHNGTTLILPTGASITTEAGDACLVVSENGTDNVRVPWYQRKDGRALAQWTYGSQVATTSGTTVELTTAIPAGATEIEILFNGVSTDTANQPPLIQLGDAGGYETSSYVGIGASIDSANAVETAVTDGFSAARPGIWAAANVLSGVVQLVRWATDEHIWVASGTLSSATEIHWVSGIKTTSEALTSIRLNTTGGTATFDAGEARIRYR